MEPYTQGALNVRGASLTDFLYITRNALTGPEKEDAANNDPGVSYQKNMTFLATFDDDLWAMGTGLHTVVNVGDLMLTSLEYAEYYTVGGQEFLFRLDDLSDWTVNDTMEQTEIAGEHGMPIKAIKKAKGINGSCSNGVMSLAALKSDVGGTLSGNNTTTIRWTDAIKCVNSDTVTLRFTPAGDPPNLYLVGKQVPNGCITNVYAPSSGDEPEQGEYAISGRTITFGDGTVQEGEIVVVRYDREMSGAQVLSNPGDTFSDDAMQILTFIGEDKACNQYLVQITFPKVVLNGTMSWGSGNETDAFNLDWTAMVSYCNGTGNRFFEMVILSEGDVTATEEELYGA